MKPFQTIIIFLFLIIFISSEDLDYCFGSFEVLFKGYCENLKINDTHRCLYSNGKCELQFKQCKDYTGTDVATCEKIKASDKYHKCKILNKNNCTEVTKECSEYEEGKTTCEYYDAGTSKRCVLNNDKCEPHYNECTLIGKDKQLCEGNIPLDSSKECYWDSTCKERIKDCNKTKYIDYSSCRKIIPKDTNKTCIEAGEYCKEEYKTCELYNLNTEFSAKNKNDCESIRIKDESDSYYFYQRCVFDNETKTCSKATSCSQFTYELGCINFIPSDNNKRCVFINGTCEEHYITCELYNDKEKTKTKEICEKIIPYKSEYELEIDRYCKCEFKSSECIRKKIPCWEIRSPSICNNQVFEDAICIYKDNKCTEAFKTCKDYDIYTPSENKNETGCKATKEHNFYGEIKYNYKCVYENNKCQKRELLKCEDYEPGQDEKYCTQIYLNDHKKCVIKDNQCIEVYKSCPFKEEKLTQEQCEAIKLDSVYYICKYDEIKGCYMKDKECSDYKGNNKTECESIKLYKYRKEDLEYKCVWDNGCKKELKKCEDAKNKIECYNIITPDNKKCIYINDECKEQYKDCESYNNNGKEQIEQSVCESIILNDYLFNTDKCSFEPGNPNKCVRKKREKCSDFKRDDFSFLCYIYTPSSSSDKCSYSNSVCSAVKKPCLELSNESGVSEETCTEAPTFVKNKICVRKKDESGCEERIGKDNYGFDNKKLMHNSLLFILFCLLL